MIKLHLIAIFIFGFPLSIIAVAGHAQTEVLIMIVALIASVTIALYGLSKTVQRARLPVRKF